jgi:hypothetical protein
MGKMDIYRDIRPGDHICMIFRNNDEKFSALIPFFRAGLEKNESCIFIADETTKPAFVTEMRNRGLDIRRFMKLGQFTLLTKHDTYLRNGCFDPDAMLSQLKEIAKKIQSDGYSAVRGAAEMTWNHDKSKDRMLEYESMLNSVIPELKSIGLCMYDESKFGPAVLAEVVHTHPFTLIYGSLYENQYYFSPAPICSPGYEALPGNAYDLIKKDIMKEI